jgi:hypothetical protein
MAAGQIAADPIRGKVAAVSCGIHNDTPVLDLDYVEDSAAGADGNFVLTSDGNIVEAQVTAEGATYDEEGLLRLLRLPGSVAPRSSPRRTGPPADDAPPRPRQAGHRQPQSRQDPRDLRAARPLWHRARFRDRPRSAEPEEIGTTFIDNAMLKARAAADLSGLPPLPTTAGCASTRLAVAPASIRRAGPNAPPSSRRMPIRVKPSRCATSLRHEPRP